MLSSSFLSFPVSLVYFFIFCSLCTFMSFKITPYLFSLVLERSIDKCFKTRCVALDFECQWLHIFYFYKFYLIFSLFWFSSVLLLVVSILSFIFFYWLKYISNLSNCSIISKSLGVCVCSCVLIFLFVVSPDSSWRWFVFFCNKTIWNNVFGRSPAFPDDGDSPIE